MKNIFKYYFIIATLFTIGCSKAQKNNTKPNQVVVTKLKTQIPVKISFYENNDTIASLFVPQEFKLFNKDDLSIILDNFQVRSYNFREKFFSSVQGMNKNGKITPPIYDDKLVSNEERKYHVYVFFIISLEKHEKENLLDNAKITNEKLHDKNVYKLGVISDNKKFLERKIGINKFIYISTFNEETIMVPDLEIPITFE